MATMTTAPVQKRTRRRHYERDQRQRFLLVTDRDRAIINAVFEYRFLRMDQIITLVGGTPKTIRNRMTDLFHAGYVDRLRTQQPGTNAYALGQQGVEFVDADDEDYARLDWRRKNTKASWHFIEHTLAIADFRIELQKAMQTRPDIRKIDGTELIAAIRETVPAKATTHPLVLREKIALDIFDPKLAEARPRTELVGTVPDYAFLFVLPDGKQRAFMMELDRSTMPVAHRGFTQSSVEKKLRVYAAAARASSAASRWGLETFRVIFVTDKPARSARIAALARTIHPDLFWTAELSGVTAPSMLLPMWRDSAGKGRVLLPQRR